jgi:hypothetical protein
MGPEPARAAADPGSKVKAEKRRFLVRRGLEKQIFLFLMLFVCFACCITRKKANRKNNSYDPLFLSFGQNDKSLGNVFYDAWICPIRLTPLPKTGLWPIRSNTSGSRTVACNAGRKSCMAGPTASSAATNVKTSIIISAGTP